MTFQSHLSGIINWLTKATSTKYERGQAEHGGELWRKAGMLAHVEAEALDQNVYIYTLRQQLAETADVLDAGNTAEASKRLRAILGPAQE